MASCKCAIVYIRYDPGRNGANAQTAVRLDLEADRVSLAASITEKAAAYVRSLAATWLARLRTTAAGTEKRRSTKPRNTVTMAVTFEWRGRSDATLRGQSTPSGQHAPHATENHVSETRKLLVRDLWRNTDPFQDLRHATGVDMQGWAGSAHPWFADIIKELSPNVIVEIGTWKGASAIHMADLLRQNDIQGLVICVDTWLGSSEHWQNEDWFKGLRVENGRPAIQSTFMNNVVARGLQDYMLPMPLDSANAALVLQQAGVSLDLIHLDAAHDEPSVAADLKAWWPILRQGGVLIGHDYYPAGGPWPGVRAAFEAFTTARGITFTHSRPKIRIQKTGTERSTDLPDTIEYTGEFGPELVLFVPFCEWLSKEGLLRSRRIKTYRGMRCFYEGLGALEIIEKDVPRVYVPPKNRPAWLPVRNEHTFDGVGRPTHHVYPDLRKKFGDLPLSPDIGTSDRPLLIVQNKHNDEWSHGPVNYISLPVLERAFLLLKRQFTIVYVRPGMGPKDPNLSDRNTDQPFEDRALLNQHPEVLCFDDLYAAHQNAGGTQDLNTFKSVLYSRCYRFISSQGGGAAQIALLSGSLLVIMHRKGEEDKWAYHDGYYSFMARVPPVMAICRNDGEITDALALFEGSTVNKDRIVLTAQGAKNVNIEDKLYQLNVAETVAAESAARAKILEEALTVLRTAVKAALDDATSIEVMRAMLVEGLRRSGNLTAS